MDDAKRIALEVAQGVLAMDESQQYGLLLTALEAVIESEPNEDFLALMACQLYRLSEIALKKSGYPVMPEFQSEAIN